VTTDVHMADAGALVAPPAAATQLPAGLPPPLPDDELVGGYKEALGELALGTFDSSAPRAYHSAFNAMASDPSGECLIRIVVLLQVGSA
jgi:hypothetical protein